MKKQLCVMLFASIVVLAAAVMAAPISEKDARNPKKLKAYLDALPNVIIATNAATLTASSNTAYKAGDILIGREASSNRIWISDSAGTNGWKTKIP